MSNIFSTYIISLALILVHFVTPRVHIKFVNANGGKCMCGLSDSRSRFTNSKLHFRQNRLLISKRLQV